MLSCLGMPYLPISTALTALSAAPMSLLVFAPGSGLVGRMAGVSRETDTGLLLKKYRYGMWSPPLACCWGTLGRVPGATFLEVMSLHL